MRSSTDISGTTNQLPLVANRPHNGLHCTRAGLPQGNIAPMANAPGSHRNAASKGATTGRDLRSCTPNSRGCSNPAALQTRRAVGGDLRIQGAVVVVTGQSPC